MTRIFLQALIFCIPLFVLDASAFSRPFSEVAPSGNDLYIKVMWPFKDLMLALKEGSKVIDYSQGDATFEVDLPVCEKEYLHFVWYSEATGAEMVDNLTISCGEQSWNLNQVRQGQWPPFELGDWLDFQGVPLPAMEYYEFSSDWQNFKLEWLNVGEEQNLSVSTDNEQGKWQKIIFTERQGSSFLRQYEISSYQTELVLRHESEPNDMGLFRQRYYTGHGGRSTQPTTFSLYIGAFIVSPLTSIWPEFPLNFSDLGPTQLGH